MPSSVPTPLAVAVGLVPTVLDGVRRLPARAVHLPIFAVSSALSGVDAFRREYDDIAARGERLIARLRGTSFDELEDSVEDALAGTPLAAPYDAVEDALEDVTEQVGAVVKRGARDAGRLVGRTGEVADRAADAVEDAAERVADTVEDAADTAADTVGNAADQAADAVGHAAETARGTAQDAGQAVQETLPEDEQPKSGPTPKASQPDMTRIDTAATPDVTETVDQVTAAVSSDEVLAHDELPLPDYDHMTLGSLRGRMRSLTVEQLVQIRTYEKAHADRLPVVTMLDNRIAKLATDAGAQPDGTPSTQPTPEQRVGSAAGGSRVSPATSGPALNPPSQGVPTNPAQPR